MQDGGSTAVIWFVYDPGQAIGLIYLAFMQGVAGAPATRPLVTRPALLLSGRLGPRTSPNPRFPPPTARRRCARRRTSTSRRPSRHRWEAALIHLDKTASDAEILAAAREMNKNFEAWIRANPEQWLWPHRRWGKDLQK